MAKLSKGKEKVRGIEQWSQWASDGGAWMVSSLPMVLFALALFFEPDYVIYLGWLHTFVVFARFALTLGIFMYYLWYRRWSTMVGVIAFFYAGIYVSTLMAGGSLYNAVNDTLPILGVLVFLDLVLRKHFVLALQAMNVVLSTMVYVNYVMLVLMPEGHTSYLSSAGNMIRRHFLGVYNQFAPVLLLTITVAILHAYLRHNRWSLNTWGVIVVSGLTVFRVWSATAIVGYGLTVGYLLILHRRPFGKWVTPVSVTAAFGVLYVNVVILRNHRVIAFFIEQVLRKDVTFSTRTVIWDASLEAIRDAFWMGQGFIAGGGYLIFEGIRRRTAHNMLLQLTLQGGIVSLLLFSAILFLALRQLHRHRESHLATTVTFMIFVFLVISMMEVYSLMYILVLLLLSFHMEGNDAPNRQSHGRKAIHRNGQNKEGREPHSETTSRILQIKQALWTMEKAILYHMPRSFAHRWYYWRRTGKVLALQNPKDFNEKLQWLIVYRYGAAEARYADKLAVRGYVEEMGLMEILPKLYATYDQVEAIQPDGLPERFVLKTSHGSGPEFYILCRDKDGFDWKGARHKLKRALKKNFAKMSLEYHYAHVKPRLFAEEYLAMPADEDLPDYKVFCFHGVPRYILVTSQRQQSLKRDYFDLQWNSVPLVKEVFKSATLPKRPENLEAMLEIAERLSKPFAFVRVDLYNINGRIYFGELTLSPATGINQTYTEEALNLLGDLIDLGTREK